MPCCVLAAFLFGLVVRSWRRLRGREAEPVPVIPKPIVPSASVGRAVSASVDASVDALVGVPV
jgi:hypothetical protein